MNEEHILLKFVVRLVELYLKEFDSIVLEAMLFQRL